MPESKSESSGATSKLVNYDWLQAKLDTDGIINLLAEFDAALPFAEDLRVIHSALAISERILTLDRTQLAAQLLGRLWSYRTRPLIHRLMEIAEAHVSGFCPLNGALAQSGQIARIMVGHTNWINGTRQLRNGALLSWSNDHTLRLWDSFGTKQAILSGHTKWVSGAIELADGRILSWSKDSTLRVWDKAGSPIAILTGHTKGVCGAVELADGRIISWSNESGIRDL